MTPTEQTTATEQSPLERSLRVLLGTNSAATIIETLKTISKGDKEKAKTEAAAAKTAARAAIDAKAIALAAEAKAAGVPVRVLGPRKPKAEVTA